MSLEAVSTQVGLVSGSIVLSWDHEIDAIAYGPDAAEELANKIIELVKQVREGTESLTKS